MSGTKIGGLKAAQKNKEIYGSDFYSIIGAVGGARGKGHAFAHGKVDPSKAGRKGGKQSRKTKA
jgi:general stress protein YciG